MGGFQLLIFLSVFHFRSKTLLSSSEVGGDLSSSLQPIGEQLWVMGGESGAEVRTGNPAVN